MNEQTAVMRPINKFFLYLLFFAFISSLLIYSNWEAINALNTEVGDFAANSLLIQDAKSFNLWVGNYSRVGFNHPGPAILLVLATGETVFFDIFNSVSSPFSGQLIAVALYNGFWLTLTLGAFTKITQSPKLAIIATLTIIASLALFDFQVFNGIWFPHLYVLPFVVMLVSVSRLGQGKTDLLQTLALSSGFLINGHVSFVAILGIILISILGLNWYNYRDRSEEKLIFQKSFFVKNAMALSISLMTFFIFFIPLIIQTAIEFPGPIASYAAVSGGHKPNTLMDAILFTSAYWGGVIPFLLGMGALWVLPRLAKLNSAHSFEITKAFVHAIFGATLALLFYAKYGVDLLDQKYIGLFYYAAPALSISALSIITVEFFKSRSANKILVVVAVVSLIATIQLIKKPASYAHLYQQPEIHNLYNEIKRLKAQDQLVLDLDNSGDWAKVWSEILGVEAYAKRRHENLFCIRKNWHISFTKSARCSDTQIASGTRIYVSDNKNSNSYGTPIFEGMGLSFYALKTPFLSTGNYTISENNALFREFALSSGWSSVEQNFVWSEGKESIIEAKVNNDFSGTISLDLGAFLPSSNYTQAVSIYLNDTFYNNINITNAEPRKAVTIQVSNLKSNTLHIKLVMHNSISPQKVGLSTDSRQLGVALYGFKIQEDRHEH